MWVVATCDVEPGGEVVSAYTLQNATKCLCDDCEKGRPVQLVGANEVGRCNVIRKWTRKLMMTMMVMMMMLMLKLKWWTISSI